MDRIEFYLGDSCIAYADSSHAPDRGDRISIRGETYQIIGKSYTLDYADNPVGKAMVCVLHLQEEVTTP